MNLLNRLDFEMAARRIVKSRTLAQQLIKEGSVAVNGNIVSKPSFYVSAEDEIEIIGELPRYVGRGGLKLEKAVDLFKIRLKDLTCIDVGASTGGFTDCMLQNGAAKVYAVDVGRDQLDEKLRSDSRVISLEQTDIRDFSLPDGEYADFIGADVSFISLKLILPRVYGLLKDDGAAVVLIKPQFEAGRSNLSKKGIVRDDKVRRKIVEDMREFVVQCGFSVIGTANSPITGGDGNIEYLLALCKRA